MPKRAATIIVPQTIAAISKGKGIDMLLSPNESENVPVKINHGIIISKIDFPKKLKLKKIFFMTCWHTMFIKKILFIYNYFYISAFGSKNFKFIH